MLKVIICSVNPEYTMRGIETVLREFYNLYGLRRLDSTATGIYTEIDREIWYKVKDVCMNEHFVMGWEIDGDTLIIE